MTLPEKKTADTTSQGFIKVWGHNKGLSPPIRTQKTAELPTQLPTERRPHQPIFLLPVKMLHRDTDNPV